MKQAVINKLALKRNRWGWLNQAAVILSAILLLSVFYANGTFTHLFSSPRPKVPVANSGGTVYRTTATATVSNVVAQALAFRAMLTTAQQDTLEMVYTTTLARKWSNLPCGADCRNGIEFASLNAAQLAGALAVIQAALSSDSGAGYAEFMQIRLAEAILDSASAASGTGPGGGIGGDAYDTSFRWICFLNTPSATGQWMLQFGGHHYAANIAFNNGHIVGATPFFMGLEPKTFSWDGNIYAPLDRKHDTLANMLASLTASELSSAKLSSTFSDCVMLPGETNGGPTSFPAKAGILCSTLTSAQKSLVLSAISNYVGDMDATTAAAIMAIYTSQIDSTYIAWTGSGTSGDAGTFLNTNTNYVRIDGPQVWIELTCQNGIVFPSQIHYHTVWRDHDHDYGVDLSGDAIDTTGTSASAVAQVKTVNAVSIYPNPATGQLSVALGQAVTNAEVTITNAIGQVIVIDPAFSGILLQYNVSALPSGIYMLRIQDGAAIYTGKFNKL